MKLIPVLEHTTLAAKHATFGLAILLITGVGGIGAARGAYVTPVAATAQSYYAGDDRAHGHAIDGTGMTPSSPVTALSTCGTSPGGTMWLSNGTTATWITFDLGSVQKIYGFHLWNYNEVNMPGRGVKTAGVYAGTTLGEGDTFSAGLNTWQINYGAETGGLNFTGGITPGSLFINLTAIPEPGSWLALGCLVGSGLMLRSRRRH
jgi:hypothetical protein